MKNLLGLAAACVTSFAADRINAQDQRAPDAPVPNQPLAAPAAAPALPALPGKVVEIWLDRPSGVTSAWLSNGILLHHRMLKTQSAPAAAPDAQPGGRRRDRQAPEVAICVSVAGAELLETAENRGVSDAAVAAAWNARSVRSMRPGELGAYFSACEANVRCFGAADCFILRVSVDSEKVEEALRGVRLLLAEPVVDPAELDRWKGRRIGQIEEQERKGDDAVDRVIGALLGPQEARVRRPNPESIRAVTTESAQAWLDRALGSGPAPKAMPMEVAIVGNIPVDRAIRLAEVYFGSLPARDRITATTFADRRVAARAQRPPEIVEANWNGAPLVMVGFFGADLRDLADHRALAICAKILSTRLERRLPPEQNEGNDAAASAMPAVVYPGFGLFLATTHAKAGSEAAASENIRKLLEEIMNSGPPAEELSAAAQELSKSAGHMLADPSYWAWVLSHSAYQGLRISEIGVADRAYQEMSPGAVQEALKKYWTPERSIKLIVKPKEAAPAANGGVER